MKIITENITGVNVKELRVELESGHEFTISDADGKLQIEVPDYRACIQIVTKNVIQIKGDWA